MTTVAVGDERDVRRRCPSHLFEPKNEDNVGLNEVNDDEKQNSERAETCSRISRSRSPHKTADSLSAGDMHKSTKTGIIGIAVLICLIGLILVINWQSINPKAEDSCVLLSGGETCHTNGSSVNAYRNYGTKTAYLIASPNETTDQFQVHGCKPHVFYLLSRHATRYPDKENIEDMMTLLPLVKEKIINSSLANKSSICQSDIERLKSWKLNMVPDNDNKLSDSGEREAAGLAQRYKLRFPDILGKEYNKNFVFEYTTRERTRSTAEAFAEGLFGKEKAQSIDFNGKFNDEVLQFHKDCKNSMKKCKGSVLDLKELAKFEDGPMMKSAISSISRRLGFNVTKDEVEVMYRACSFSFALEDDDAWCSVFSVGELKVLEYEGDLDDYYKDGYGNEINYKQACPVVNYVINLFNSSMDQTEDRAILHFSHAGAIKKVYPRFGLFHDERKLTADGICSQQDRKWKSSYISPFNSNLVLVLLKCHTDYKVIAFHNEREVTLGGCSSALCPIHEFLNKYTPFAKDCNINEMCCPCCKSQ